MIKTKYRGLHCRVNKDGTRSFYLRLTVEGKRTWRWVGDTLEEARMVQRTLKKKRMLKALGIRADLREK